MIKAASSYDRDELEAEFKRRGTEILTLKTEMTALLFRTEQNRLDTALAAGLRTTLHTICRRIINKKGTTPFAKAWLANE